METTNTTPTHGLLTEDFKQNIITLIQKHPLDIQTKAIILNYVLTAVNITAKQQTQKELEAYNQSQKRNNENNENSENEALS